MVAVLAVVGLVVLATIGVGVYGLVRGPDHNATSQHSSTSAGTSTADSGGSSSAASGPAPAVLPKTDNPVIYARAVAAALFDWSTTTGYAPSDYTSPVLADADPSGRKSPGWSTMSPATSSLTRSGRSSRR